MNKIAIIMVLLILGAALIAQEHQHMRVQQVGQERERPAMRSPMMDRMHADREFRMLDRANLTEQQREQIRTFQRTHRLEMIDLKAEEAKLRLQLRSAMTDHNFREAKRLNDQLYTKKGEIARKGIELREQIHQTLTDEQRDMMRRSMRQRMRDQDCEDCEH